MIKRGNRVGTAVVVIAAVMLAACGGSSKGSAPTTVADPARDKAAAQKLVLVQSDFPTGWTGSAHKKDPQETQILKQLATCTGATDPAKQTATIDGDDFDKGDAEVSVAVGVAATRADFETDVAAIRSPKHETCYKAELEKLIKDEIAKEKVQETLDSVDIKRISSATYGDATVAINVTMKLTAQSQTFTLYVDDYQYGKGRTEVDLSFSNDSAPFDTTLEKTLLKTATARLTEAA